MSWDMMYEWQPSADHTTTIMGAGELGGIPELIYKPVRFKRYLWNKYDLHGTVKPIIVDSKSYDVRIANEGVKFNDNEVYRKYSGKGIFCALYNLAKYLNDTRIEIGDPVKHIVEFCTEYIHPYFTDELYDTLSEDNIYSNEMFERLAAFSVEQFMNDLSRFYNAASLYFALQDVKRHDMKAASRLSKEGRFFEGLPFFEQYKRAIPEAEWGTDGESISTDDLISEMQKSEAYPIAKPHGTYKEMLSKLADIMPPMNMRVRLDPNTNRMVFAAEVNSAFDIAWFTLSRMLTANGVKYHQGKSAEGIPKELAVVTCLNCGEAFPRRSNRQQFCTKEECRKAHNAQRQKKYRENKKLKDIE